MNSCGTRNFVTVVFARKSCNKTDDSNQPFQD
jgi:hypothetical protein